MHPWLLYTESFRVPTYFACLMVGFAVATGVLRREALRRRLRPADVLDLALWLVPSVLVGARLAHVVLVDPTSWRSDPLTVLWSPGGGFVFYGGLLTGVLAVKLWATRRGISPWALADCYAPATAMGLVFGRLGCLGGGCCYGKPADWPFGVVVPWAVRYYRRGHLPEPLLGASLHPAPVYASLFALALFVGLSHLARRPRFEGQVTLVFLGSYAVGRTLLEATRADVERGLYLGGWVSTSQLLSAVVLVAAVGMYRRRGLKG